MTLEELIEREAAFLFQIGFPGYAPDPNWMGIYRDKARSLNRLLNKCGVRMQTADSLAYQNHDGSLKHYYVNEPLPEAKEE
jgi:hypothetical protein